MELTEKMKEAFTILKTVIALEEFDTNKQKVLKQAYNTLLTEISDAEYVVHLNSNNKLHLEQILKESMERIIEETNQKDLTFKIITDSEMNNLLRENVLNDKRSLIK